MTNPAHAKSTAEHPFGASRQTQYLTVTRGTPDQDVQAMQLRAKGYSFRTIGATLGIGKDAAHRSVQRQLERLATELRAAAAEVRELEDVRLDEMLVRNSEMVEQIYLDADMDIEKRVLLMVKIHDSMIRIMERRAKMFGIDAPAKAELTTNNGPPVSYEDMMRDLDKQKFEAVEAHYEIPEAKVTTTKEQANGDE